MAPTLPAPRELDRGLLLLLTGLLFTPISLWALVDLGGRQGASGEVGLMLPATAAGLLFEIYLTHLVRDGVGWARALLIVMNAPLSLMALPIAVGVLIQIGDVPFAMILFALVLMLLLAGSMCPGGPATPLVPAVGRARGGAGVVGGLRICRQDFGQGVFSSERLF